MFRSPSGNGQAPLQPNSRPNRAVVRNLGTLEISNENIDSHNDRNPLQDPLILLDTSRQSVLRNVTPATSNAPPHQLAQDHRTHHTINVAQFANPPPAVLQWRPPRKNEIGQARHFVPIQNRNLGTHHGQSYRSNAYGNGFQYNAPLPPNFAPSQFNTPPANTSDCKIIHALK